MAQTPLELEILKSARLRTTILLIIFLLLSFFWTLFIAYSPEKYHRFMGKEASVYILPGYFIIVAIYFSLTHFYTQRKIKVKHNIPQVMRYLNTCVEVSIPTIIILIVSHFRTPVYVLLMPPILLYYLFIALSALTLNKWLCYFSGFVAAAEYISVAYYFTHYTDISTITPFLTSWYGFVLRALILFMGGIVTGLITMQIKKQIITACDAQNERDRIESIFGQHVSPEVVSKLLSKDANSSEYIPVCVMFLDIRNFTNFSEKNTPADVVHYLNHLFEYMIEIIHENKGIINKFLGDGFMAVFGAPLSSGNDVANAVNASMEIIKRTEEEISAGRIPDFKLGIGLHFGYVVTGTIGTKRRLEYTIIGDVVNSAAHIEQLNKEYHSSILISKEALQKIPDVKAELIGSASLKHRDKPMELYRLI